jgi:hypothetical protein
MRIRWVDHVACMGGMRNAHKILVGKSEGKRPVRRPTHRWENITMDMKETRCAVRTGCVRLMTGFVLGSYEDCNEPSGIKKVGNFLTS